jgi:hypothetical protein
MNIVWSFSSLKTFQQCPRKYHHTKILKDIVEPDTTATLYGKTAHTVAEEYIKDGKPIPPAFEYMKDTLDALNRIEGEKLCEVKLGLTKNLESCEFNAPNVWWHGIADLGSYQSEEGSSALSGLQDKQECEICGRKAIGFGGLWAFRQVSGDQESEVRTDLHRI